MWANCGGSNGLYVNQRSPNKIMACRRQLSVRYLWWRFLSIFFYSSTKRTFFLVLQYQFVFLVISLPLFSCTSLLDEKITNAKADGVVYYNWSILCFIYICLLLRLLFACIRFHVCSFVRWFTCSDYMRMLRRSENEKVAKTHQKVQTVQMKYLHFAFPYFYHRIIMTIFSFIEFILDFWQFYILLTFACFIRYKSIARKH